MGLNHYWDDHSQDYVERRSKLGMKIMSSCLQDMVSSSLATNRVSDQVDATPNSVTTPTASENADEVKLVFKPLIPANYIFIKADDCVTNSEESDETLCSYSGVNVDKEIVSAADFEFGINEEIVETDICGEDIDKRMSPSPEQSIEALGWSSFLDEIPKEDTSSILNGNVELYLECSDDNETSQEKITGVLKPILATSQIKMDTQFKVSFPLIPERGLKCSICNLLFLSKDFLREHAIAKHLKQFLFCSECSYFTKSKKFYITHLETRHKISLALATSTLTSEDERNIFDNLDSNKEAKDEVKVVPVIKDCKNSKAMKKVKEKVKNEPKEPDYEVLCEFCGYKTHSMRLLHYHEQTMHDIHRKVFQCTECDYTCLQRRSIIAHQRKHLGVYEFQCKTCDKKFVSKHLLTRHSKRHNSSSCKRPRRSMKITNTGMSEDFGELAVESTLTMKSSSTQTVLAKRPQNGTVVRTPQNGTLFRTAHNGIVVKTPQNGTVVRNPQDGTVVKTPKNGTEYIDVCSETNRSQSVTKTNVHKKKFICGFDGCSKEFRDSFNLRNHHFVHLRSNPIKCEHCTFRCNQITSLNHHMKTRH